MSHHYSGPNFGFPHGKPQLDFTDLYAFPKVGGKLTSVGVPSHGDLLAEFPYVGSPHGI